MNTQKGSIAPLLVVILLIIGIVVGTKLINIPQIFKSRASAPATLPTPIFEDDFSTNTGWEYLGTGGSGSYGSPNWSVDVAGINSIGEYLASEGVIRILVTQPRGYRYLQRRINMTGEFTAIFDFTLRNSISGAYHYTGMRFGGPGSSNVYAIWISNLGTIVINGGTTEHIVNDLPTGEILNDNKNYRVRVDRRLSELKVWLSADNGASYKLIAKTSVDPIQALGADGAMYMGFVYQAYQVGQNYPEARFDNFKVWRLGQVPEPVVGATPTPTPVPSGSPLPSLAFLNPTPISGTTISNTDTITVTATVNNGDRFDIWVDWKCFVTTSLSGQTYGFTLAQIADASGKPECKTPGSHTVHVAPMRGAGGTAGRSDGATYIVRP